MPAQIIDGKSLSAKIRDHVAAEVAALKAQGKPVRLIALLVGDNPSAKVYADNQKKNLRPRLASITSSARCRRPPPKSNCTMPSMPSMPIHPSPASFSTLRCLTVWTCPRLQYQIDIMKDVEGVNPANIGHVVYGHTIIAPCTALAVVELIDSTGRQLQGANVTVIGASRIVGRPLALLLTERNATVTLCHIHTKDTPAACRNADIIVVAVGKPGLLRAEHVKPGAVVIDVGINRVKITDSFGKVTEKTVGDVDYDAVAQVADPLHYSRPRWRGPDDCGHAAAEHAPCGKTRLWFGKTTRLSASSNFKSQSVHRAKVSSGFRHARTDPLPSKHSLPPRRARPILTDISWQVMPGEIAAVLGANGCGKSTLLRIASGYLWPQRGTVQLFGGTYGEVPLAPLRARVGIVEATTVYPFDDTMTARDVAVSGYFSALTLGYVHPTAQQIGHAEILLAQVGLEKHRDQLYQTLSTGERLPLPAGSCFGAPSGACCCSMSRPPGWIWRRGKPFWRLCRSVAASAGGGKCPCHDYCDASFGGTASRDLQCAAAFPRRAALSPMGAPAQGSSPRVILRRPMALIFMLHRLMGVFMQALIRRHGINSCSLPSIPAHTLLPSLYALVILPPVPIHFGACHDYCGHR